MIIRQFSNPRVIFQTPDDEDMVAEQAIAVSCDASGLIVINQEGRELLINRASVPDLVRVLREMSKPRES
ncbi:MAG TPA: hypothetical protein PLN31_17215 [Azoarcus taiwanensis]|nr:hypothetical protein [Azoarcus taiwanensis]